MVMAMNEISCFLTSENRRNDVHSRLQQVLPGCRRKGKLILVSQSNTRATQS